MSVETLQTQQLREKRTAALSNRASARHPAPMIVTTIRVDVPAGIHPPCAAERSQLPLGGGHGPYGPAAGEDQLMLG